MTRQRATEDKRYSRYGGYSGTEKNLLTQLSVTQLLINQTGDLKENQPQIRN